MFRQRFDRVPPAGRTRCVRGGHCERGRAEDRADRGLRWMEHRLLEENQLTLE